MKRFLFLMMLAMFTLAKASAQFEELAARLQSAPVQEKVYLHTDNPCYFKGDTIWYKAYVTRADDLHYTDMSRIVYVELVSPDGMVVERQNLIVTDKGYGDGNFALQDTLYSGYYELRAYTRWMLNFCVTERPFLPTVGEYFYNRQMAHDFFRQFGNLYSRVVPIYEKPEVEGDYLSKFIVERPKTRLDAETKPRLEVTFYPEGGHLIAGNRNRVAFEAVDQEGRQVEVSGTLKAGTQTQKIHTVHQGRGVFTLDAPLSGRAEATFVHDGKEYSFKLPRMETAGCALQLRQEGETVLADVTLQDVPLSNQYAVAILCRGALKHLEPIQTDAKGHATLKIDSNLLPTGVNDLVVVDQTGAPLADRLFFVNHHDYEHLQVSVEGLQDRYEPLEPVCLQFQAPVSVPHLSISVRDGFSDEPTYDTGNMLTDLLLTSDVKGFVADPAWYFASDDEEHTQALDLLMLVQGWRRYDYASLASQEPLRYLPEVCMTVEGGVYKMRSFDDVQPEGVSNWVRGIGVGGHARSSISTRNSLVDADQARAESGFPDVSSASENSSATLVDEGLDMESNPDAYFGLNNPGLKHEVTLVGELVLGDEVADIEMETTDGGHFAFNLPPYYGEAILFLSAHKTDISDKRLKNLENKDRLNEDAWPEFYVKRDLFFPVLPGSYSYYQNHQPESFLDREGEEAMIGQVEQISTMDQQLADVTVDARRRRGRTKIDYSKPVCVYDTYYLYNMCTDYGLSHGKLNFRLFPEQVSIMLLGNYNGAARFPNVSSRFDEYNFYNNFDINPKGTGIEAMPVQNRSDAVIYKNLHLKRQFKIRLFSDFEFRNPDRPLVQGENIPDITLDFVLVPNDGTRRTYRDRRIILPGFYMPDAFYSPDYSQRALPEGQKDYRRTLYWNANVPLDAEGRCSIRFYNNSQPTKLRVSVAGLSVEGQPVVTQE